MTYKEAVTEKIGEYSGEKWGLTPAEAYAIVEFLNRQDEGAEVNSDDVEKELKNKLKKDVDIEFANLNDFVEYLKDDLEKTIEVVKTDAEKIDYAIAAYYPSHKISGLSDDDAKAALVEIAKHLNTLPPNWKTKSSIIMEELQNAGKIPNTVNLSYDDLVAYIEALDDEKYFENKPMIVEEELTLRQRIDALLLPETPEAKLDGVAYDSYRLDSLLTKDGDINASDVKNTWADAITASFMPALSDANSGILKQDPNIPTVINNAAETETKSRIATTTDGTVPSSLKTDIENYVDALYEANSADMDSALDSLLSDENKLSVLNTTESRSTINSKILTDVTANGDAMNAKTNSVYTDLPEIVEAIRRYAVMYEIGQTDLQNKVLNEYNPSTGGPKAILRDASTAKIVQNVDNSLGRDYLITYLRYNYYMVEENGKYPNAVSQILTDIKTVNKTDPRERVNYAVEDLIRKHYVKYFVDTTEKESNTALQTTLKNRILNAFMNKQYTDDDGVIMNLSTQNERIMFVKKKTHATATLNSFKCLYIPETTDGNNNCTAILNRIKQNKRSEIVSILNQDFIPLAAKNTKSAFTTPIIDYFFNYYGVHPDMVIRNVYNIYIDNLVKYCFNYAWVPSTDILDEINGWQSYVSSTFTNSNIPASITTDIQTKIQNALKNLGSGKTLKEGLRSQLNVSGTSALVNDENEWPVANGTSEIDNYKYTDAFDNKTKVNILDYTYDKLIGDVRAIDAKTAYEVLKARANATNDAAIDSLVSSNLREALRTAIANITSASGVESAASQVLTGNITSQKANTSDDVKDRYAKIYRSVNIGSNAVNLSGATNVTNINAAFDAAIFSTMNGYLAPNGTAGIFDGVEGGVTGFIDVIYGTDAAAKAAAVRQVAMNWITAREEEFKAADIAEMLNDIKETRNPSDRLKYQIEAYLSSHNIASLPVEDDAAKAKLVQVVEYLQTLGENATVKTTDIDIVAFTFPELEAFVDHFKGKEDIPSTISAVKTEDQKLDYAVADYMKNHSIAGQTEAVIREIVAYLEEQGSATVTSDDVKNHLADQHIIADKDALTLDYQNLIDLKNCLAAQDRSVSTNIERTTEERVRYEVDEYLRPTNTGAEAHTLGDLTRDQAFDLAMYLKGLENKTVSGEVVLDAVPSLSGKTLPYEDLKAFVEYLTDLEGLTVTVVRNESDLRDEINTILASNFRPDSVADGVAFDDTVFDELIGGTEEVSGADVEDILLAKTASNVFSANADWWKQDADAVSDAASLDSQITAVFPNSVLASEGDDGYDTLQTEIESFVEAYNSSTAATAGNTELSNILTESNNLSALNLTSTRSTIKTSLESSETVNSKVNAFHNALQTSARGVRDYALAYVMEDAESRQDLLDLTSADIDSKITIKQNNYASKIITAITNNKPTEAKKYLKIYLKISDFYRDLDSTRIEGEGLIDTIYEEIKKSSVSSSVERVRRAIKDVILERIESLLYKTNSTDFSQGKEVFDVEEEYSRGNDIGRHSTTVRYVNANNVGNIVTAINNSNIDSAKNLIEAELPYGYKEGKKFRGNAESLKTEMIGKYQVEAYGNPEYNQINGFGRIYKDRVAYFYYNRAFMISGLMLAWPYYIKDTFTYSNVPTSVGSMETGMKNYIATKGDKTTKISALKTFLTDTNSLICLARLKNRDYNWSVKNESGTTWYLAPGDKYDSTDKSVTTINYTYGNIKTPLDEIDKSATYAALGNAVKNTRVGALTTGGVLNSSLATAVANNTLGVVDSAAVRDAIYSMLVANISESAAKEGFTKMYRGRQLGTHTVSGDTQSDVRNSVDSQIAAGIMRYLGRDMILSDYQKSGLVTAVDAAVGASSADQQSAIANYLHFSASKAAKIAAILNELRTAVKDKD
ncbi:MAG: hypothetical protein J6T91_02025 [Alphaproteobacteria bacterium]|nr:hypothetical protein [Alphaproteobacteria bacterium]